MTQRAISNHKAIVNNRRTGAALEQLWEFLNRQRVKSNARLCAASLFSGGGIGDIGYEQAGFEIILQAELDSHRVELSKLNFPRTKIVRGDIIETKEDIITALCSGRSRRLDILSVTPPCQGMSSSNPGRGKVSDARQRDKRNRLLLESLPIINTILPRIIVVENVIQVLKEEIEIKGHDLQRVVDAFQESLPEYKLFAGVVQMADYGIPQMRKRAILVAIHRQEPALPIIREKGLNPWPSRTHSERPVHNREPWISINEWFDFANYEPLDALSTEKACSSKDALHFVPVYKGDHYLRVADIPKNSGQNAYQNSFCHVCSEDEVPLGKIHCPKCGSELRNRPYVRLPDGTIRLIRGFNSSYRRMLPDRPSSTITTNSSHVGSDYKIHPSQNRVLSIRECADLQTVPRYYDWTWALKTKHTYVARQVIGEAIPAFFTYKHGLLLRDILDNNINESEFERLNSH